MAAISSSSMDPPAIAAIPASALSIWSEKVAAAAIVPTPPSVKATSSKSPSPSLIGEDDSATNKSAWKIPPIGSSSEHLGLDNWPPLQPGSARVPPNAGSQEIATSIPAPRSVEQTASTGITSHFATPNGDPRERVSHGRGNAVNVQLRCSYRIRGGATQYFNYGGQNRDFNNNMNSKRPVLRFTRPAPPPPPLPHGPGSFTVPRLPFGGPIGYSNYPPCYVPQKNMPFFHDPLSPVFASPTGHDLHAKIAKQIEYYFSLENLVKDTYLRQNMDQQGWVPIKLIAGFKKIKLLADNIHLIKDALRNSSVVEFQGDKLRTRKDWGRWPIPPTMRFDGVLKGMQNLTAN